MPWHKYPDEKPTYDETVLVRTSNNMFFVFSFPWNDIIDLNATHWMDIPALPGKELPNPVNPPPPPLSKGGINPPLKGASHDEVVTRGMSSEDRESDVTPSPVVDEFEVVADPDHAPSILREDL